VLTEEDWGNMFVELVEKYGKEASNEAKYAASKNLAEKGMLIYPWLWTTDMNAEYISCMGILQCEQGFH
jgi:hypothetical protein